MNTIKVLLAEDETRLKRIVKERLESQNFNVFMQKTAKRRSLFTKRKVQIF